MTIKKKRIISILLIVVMILSMIPVLTISVMASPPVYGGGGSGGSGGSGSGGSCSGPGAVKLEATPAEATWKGRGTVKFSVDEPNFNFRKLRHNWNFVNDYNYEVGTGGHSITLSKDFLKTLEKGYNLITAHFTDHKFAEFHLWIE